MQVHIERDRKRQKTPTVTTLVARAQPRFKNWVTIFPACPYKRPTTAVKGVDAWGMGRGVLSSAD